MDASYVPYKSGEACRYLALSDPAFPKAMAPPPHTKYPSDARLFAVRVAAHAGCTVGRSPVTETVEGWKSFQEAGGNATNRNGGYLGLSANPGRTILYEGVPVVVHSAIVKLEKDQDLENMDEESAGFHRVYNDIRVLRALRRAYLDANPDMLTFPRIIGHAVAMSRRNERAERKYVHVAYIATRAGTSASAGATLMDYLSRRDVSWKYKHSALVQSLAALRLVHSLGIGHGDAHTKNFVVFTPDAGAGFPDTAKVMTASGKTHLADGPTEAL